MNALVYQMFGDNNFKNSIWDINKQEKEGKQLRPVNSGKQSLILKFRQEHLICFTKILATENQINKI